MGKAHRSGQRHLDVFGVLTKLASSTMPMNGAQRAPIPEPGRVRDTEKGPGL